MARCVRVCALRMGDAVRHIDCIHKAYCSSVKTLGSAYENEDTEEIENENVPKIEKSVPETIENVPNMSESVPMKVCKKCGQEKPITEFPKSKTAKDGHEGQCTRCKMDAAKALRKKRKEEAAAKRFEEKQIRMKEVTKKFWGRGAKKAEDVIERPSTALGMQQEVVIEVKDHKLLHIINYTDQELVDELRRRGIEVIAKKTVTIDL